MSAKKPVELELDDLPPKPLPFLRQVLALMLDPGLLAKSETVGATVGYPADAVALARRLLAEFPGGSIGSYTHTGGQPVVRQLCADYLTRRDPDATASCLDDVQVTCGSAEAVRLLLEAFGRRQPGRLAAALIPSPGRPMYAAFCQQVDVRAVSYKLTASPSDGIEWQLDESELEAAYQTALQAGCEPRILVLVNPGQPTGQFLTLASLRAAADFASRRRLLVIADETMQFAKFGDESSSSFIGFRRVVFEQQRERPELPPLEVASLASLSEGLFGGGEAGFRVGFCELLNLHPVARHGLLTVLACTSCPPVLGQAALAVSVSNLPDSQSAELAAARAAAWYRRGAEVARRRLLESGAASTASLPSAGGKIFPLLRVFPFSIVSREFGDGDSSEPVDAAFCRAVLSCQPGKDEVENVDGQAEAWLQPGSHFGRQPDVKDAGFYVSISFKFPVQVLTARLNRLINFRQELLNRCAN